MTDRHYDYGRWHELHLERAVAVSHLESFDRALKQAPICSEARLIGDDEASFLLDLVHWTEGQNVSVPDGKQMWFHALERRWHALNCLSWQKGDCLRLDGDCAFILTTGRVSALLIIPR